MSRGAWSGALGFAATPVIVTALGEMIVQITGTILLSRIGVMEVAAFGMSTSIVDLCMALAAALLAFVLALAARRPGVIAAGGPAPDAGRLLLPLAGVTLALAAMLALLAGPISAALLSSGEVTCAVAGFLRIAALGIVLRPAHLACAAALAHQGRTRVLAGGVVLLALSHLILAAMLVFGGAGAPAMGLRGAALGGVGAEAATLIYFGCHLGALPAVRRRELLAAAARAVARGRAAGRLVAPGSLPAILKALRWLGFFLIVERMGPLALAQSCVLYCCYAVFAIPASGFTELVRRLVSRLIRTEEFGYIPGLVRHSVVAACALSLPMALLGFLFPDLILAIVAPGTPGLAEPTVALRVVAAGMPIIVPAEICLVAVGGAGDTAAACGIELALAVAMIGSSYLSASVAGAGLPWVWTSLPAAWLAGLGLSCAWLRSGRWILAGLLSGSFGPHSGS